MKGETFYSRNAVLQQLLAGHPVQAIDPGLTDKFVLLRVDG
jgi:hypothetical protein